VEIESAEMRFLRPAVGHTLKDQVKNEHTWSDQKHLGQNFL
jgi:hypothetical protein